MRHRFLREPRGGVRSARPPLDVRERVERGAEQQGLRGLTRAEARDRLPELWLGVRIASDLREDAAGVEAHRGEVAGERVRVGREHPQGVTRVLLRLPDAAGARLDQGLPGEIDRDLEVAGAEALAVDRQRFGDERPGRLGVARIVPGAGEHA